MDNIDKLSNEQLIQIIKKYKICELKPMSREQALGYVKKFMESKTTKGPTKKSSENRKKLL